MVCFMFILPTVCSFRLSECHHPPTRNPRPIEVSPTWFSTRIRKKLAAGRYSRCGLFSLMFILNIGEILT